MQNRENNRIDKEEELKHLISNFSCLLVSLKFYPTYNIIKAKDCKYGWIFVALTRKKLLNRF